MSLIAPNILTQQPQYAPQIDWGNPVTQGLVGLIPGGAAQRPGYDVITGLKFPNISAPVASTSGLSSGQTAVGTGGISSNRIGTDSLTNWRPSSQKLSLVAAFHQYGAGGSDVIIAGNGFGVGTGYHFYERFSDGTVQFSLYDGSARQFTSASSSLAANARNVVCLACDGATMRGYINGRAVGSVATGGGSVTYDATYARTSLAGTPDANGAAMAGHWMGLWNRSLSAAEAKSLAENPWQIFKAPSRKIFLNVAGGASTYTISPTGSIVYSGTTSQTKTRVYVPTGNVTYSGTAPNVKTRVYVPTGDITFTGTAAEIKTKVYVPTGTIDFSGTAALINPALVTNTTLLPLTGVGK